MVGTCLEECNKVSTVTRRLIGQSTKIPVPCQRLSKITAPVWVVLISMIK